MTAGDAVPPQGTAEYMAAVAASAPGREYKAVAMRALALSPGLVVADVGCGPGTDLAALAQAVGPTGTVLGIDHDAAMLTRAASSMGGSDVVQLHLGDAHALPVPDAAVDRVRTDRALQHVLDPRRVLSEVARILRPGGRAVFAEPDWDSLVIAAEDLRSSGQYRDYVRDVVIPHGRIGRQVARDADAAGLEVCDVTVSSALFTEHAMADMVLGMSRNVARAIASGHLTEDARRWADSLRTAPFVAALSVFVVTVERRP